MNQVTQEIDVVGIGALNIDFILEKRIARNINPRLIFGDDFEPGKTTRTKDAADIPNDILEQPVKVYPGGSAFNTIRAIAKSEVGLSLGFIGVHGPPEHGVDFQKITSELGIENKFVVEGNSILPYLSLPEGHQVSTPINGGMCLSYMDRDRTLKVYGGSNMLLGGLLDSHRDEIIDYLSKARWIHFSSFFDEIYDTPAILYLILEEVLQINPSIGISFDPGHVYSERKSASIKKLLTLADQLFLNFTEFRLITSTGTSRADENVASKRIFQNCPSLNIVIAKKYNSILVLHQYKNRVWRKEYPTTRMPNFLVKDDTGAGDVFAAGFIMSKLVPILGDDMYPAIRLANRLVREKLKDFGDSRYDYFSQVVDSFVFEQYERKFVSPELWYFENRVRIIRTFTLLMLAFLVLLVSSLAGLVTFGQAQGLFGAFILGVIINLVSTIMFK
jgi:sugar/nucleoside kinase (ribokinase family)